MPVALITGCAGLIGMETCQQYARDGYVVVGVDNDMRRSFFGEEASTAHNIVRLESELDGSFHHQALDIRDREGIDKLFRQVKPDVIVHTAAQPSHDWAARDPHTDFEVNALGTLNLLQATREHTPYAPFVHCSTSKVYGARPNELPLFRNGKRFDLPHGHEFYDGITTAMSVDLTTHSLFGVSKLSGDLLVQEFGRYFGMPTVCFRPGCLTGGGHAGTELHGFLSYLMRATVERRKYTVYGYGGLQVRCNIHSEDLVRAFLAFTKDPDEGAVYNIGGGRTSNCSMLEAIELCEEITGLTLDWSLSDEPRIGDHMWWISDNAAFQERYPLWGLAWTTTEEILNDIYEQNRERWVA